MGLRVVAEASGFVEQRGSAFRVAGFAGVALALKKQRGQGKTCARVTACCGRFVQCCRAVNGRNFVLLTTRR
jgi:hypothetical protein